MLYALQYFPIHCDGGDDDDDDHDDEEEDDDDGAAAVDDDDYNDDCNNDVRDDYYAYYDGDENDGVAINWTYWSGRYWMKSNKMYLTLNSYHKIYLWLCD